MRVANRVRHLVAFVVVGLLVVAGPAFAQQQRGQNKGATTLTASDSFNKVSYNGSTGTVRWDGPWREIGESDGPKNGAVGVETGPYCDGGACLVIDGGAAGFVGERGVYREVGFDNATAGTVRFDYRRVASTGGGSLVVSLSGDGGISYVTIASIALDRHDSATRSINVSAINLLSDDTVLRFVGLNLAPEAAVYVDDVLVTAVPAPISTTTTSTTTTAPPGPTTTTSTSRPPRTTTTTTTTTLPLPTTTTSLPLPTTTSTTTTQPPLETTTTTPPQTTTSSTTTTIVPPAIGLPGGATTSTTQAPSTTSGSTPATTTSTTTSTAAPPTPTDVQAEGLTGLPEDGGGGNGLTPDELAEFLDKSSLVLEITPPPEVSESITDQLVGPVLTPLEGLAAGVNTSVERLQGSSITAILLGLFVAWLGVRGIDRRTGEGPKSRLPA